MLITNTGMAEAESAGKALKEAGYKFDVAFSSVLKRANKTLSSVLKALDQEDISTHYSWRLNERHYGDLTGLNKAETAKKFGDEQVSCCCLFNKKLLLNVQYVMRSCILVCTQFS